MKINETGVYGYLIKVMAVYDRDTLYAARLADYVNQKEKLPFTAMAFSDLQYLKNYGKEHPIEILLIGEQSRQEAKEIKASRVIVLCEGNLVEEKEDEAAIYKYQSGDCIIKEVLACYCRGPVEPALAFLRARALVMGIYSPVNRCLKTSLALTIGQLLARNLSVLYISLEEFSGFSRLVGSNIQGDLSDVFYLYCQGDFHWMKLRSVVHAWGEMDYIAPARYGEDISQINTENLSDLIEKIARESGYDRLVIDIGRIRGNGISLLNTCDVVYMPVKEDFLSAAKIAEFEEYLDETGSSQIKEKIQKLKLPRQIGTVKGQGFTEQLLWSELGDYVRNLLKGGVEGPVKG